MNLITSVVCIISLSFTNPVHSLTAISFLIARVSVSFSLYISLAAKKWPACESGYLIASCKVKSLSFVGVLVLVLDWIGFFDGMG